MNRKGKVLLRYLPAVVYSALVIVLSNIPNLSPPDIGFNPGDKILHFIEYFIFALLWYRAFSYSIVKTRISIYILLITYGGIFAALDEFHQKYIPMREMDIWDFTADISGLLVAVIIFRIWSKYKSSENFYTD